MRAERRSGSLMAAPYAVFLLAFAAYPIVFALVLVFLRWDLVTAPSFAGLDNLRDTTGINTLYTDYGPDNTISASGFSEIGRAHV